jgi:hypothetical protein
MVGRQSTTILDDPPPVEVLHDGAWGAGLADRLPARGGLRRAHVRYSWAPGSQYSRRPRTTYLELLTWMTSAASGRRCL